MDNNEISSVSSTPATQGTPGASTPATQGTPGAPLFGGFRSERTGNGSRKKSLLKNLACFSVEDWTLEDGALPKVGAEFIGTYILMFAGIATAIVNQKTHNSETLIGCAGATGLAVMSCIIIHDFQVAFQLR